ncbi:MAG: alkaline phosphatase family protein [Anaerolineales bacterium]|nr:alkaline phosphatase family protein [Anaerolineales bacterium]
MMHARGVPTLILILFIGFVLVACSAGGEEIAAPTNSPLPSEIPSSPTSTIPPSPEASPTAVIEPTLVVSHPVLLISWDGAPAGKVYELMAEGELQNFDALARRGLRADFAQSVDPSLTAAAQNSLASGSLPMHTGIVSNKYHNSNDSFYWYRRGFDEVMDQAEPVWVTASRAGLKTAAVFSIGASPDHPGQTADYTIGYGVRDAYSRQETVSLSPAQAWSDAPNSYSPLLEADYQIPQVVHIYLLVIDSTDDEIKNYDTVSINTTRRVEKNSPGLGEGEWGELVILPSVYAGADFLIQEIGAEQVTFYHTGVYHNTASPRSLLENLNHEFGFFRAGADSYALEHDWITYEDYLYLLERGAYWMAEVTAWVYETYRPDLLFTWQNTFDAAGHAFYLQNSLQPDYSPERAQAFDAYYRRAARISDQALGSMLEVVDLETSTVMLVGDHGMAPIHTSIYINTVLEQAGLLVLDERNYVVVEDSRAFAVASGGAAHIYINLLGREKKGIVSAEEYQVVQAQIVDLLSFLVDPSSGKLVFQRVLTKDEIADIGLDHPNSGDIFVQAEPGYNLDDWRGRDDVFAPARFYGQHGYDSSLPEMYTIFISGGFGVPPGGEVIPPVSVLDYAPTIAHMLGFDPAPTVDGVPIPAITLP